MPGTSHPRAAGALPRRLFYYNAGFWRDARLRRILELAGHELRAGLTAPGPEDGVVVWGRSPYAHRGEAAAAKHGLPLVRVEDAFLRSLRPGRMGDAPLGLLIDGQGVHFDSGTPSTLEKILALNALDDSNLLSRARDGIGRFQAMHLSKYNIHDIDLKPPEPGYVLVIDQTRGDASIRHSGASAATFAEMLVRAQTDHPRAKILIKTHPETQLGLRPGHFGPADAQGRVSLLTAPHSPWNLFDGALAVYTVSSQLGFEAVLAGHRPLVFGQPFYTGWGLTDDQNPLPRRNRSLTRAQLFAAAMILAPLWYDPCRDRLCSFEAAVDQMEAEVRAFRADRHGHVAVGMRLWKRHRLQAFFGREKPLICQDDPDRALNLAQKTGRRIMVWAGKHPGLAAPGLLRVEDGFLRSRGLGAQLVPPLSLITDDEGIYYDPTRPSQLETLITAPFPPGGKARAEALIAAIVKQRLSKYNLAAGPLPPLPRGPRILVPGQVEDDASIRLGAGAITTNHALLQETRRAHPLATILYKPHPDVEAGLRPGALSEDQTRDLADLVVPGADPVELIGEVDQIWTMTSLLGFEALLRGKSVTCLGAPFYAGWGLTDDLVPVPRRRHHAPDGHPMPRPSLAKLAYAALIAYPRYLDPISRRPCPPEVALERLGSGDIPRASLTLRSLAKLQGALASHSWLWR